jgi:multiple sugar transport system permease protein
MKWQKFLRHPATPFLLPAVAYLFVLTIYPFLYSVVASLFNLSLTNPKPPNFVGLDNYRTLLTDGLFYTGLLNTLFVAFFSIVIEFIIGFAMAHLFIAISDVRGSEILRTIYILPMMVTPVVTGLLWSYILDPLFGVANYLLQVCGMGAQPWFSAPETALWTVVFVSVWQWSPFLMLISIAALVSIPRELYEAARIDGAKWYHILTRIELPLIRNTVLIGVIFRLIDSFRLFDIIYASTRGGPGQSTEVVSLYAYRQIFQYFNAGYGSAAAVLILIIAILLANVAVRFLGKESVRA